MSKVLQIVSLIAGIAATIVTAGAAAPILLGIKLTATALLGIAVATSIGASLLAPRPSAPENSRGNVDRLTASIDPRTGRKSVVGSTAMATDIRDEEFTDEQEFLNRWVVVAAHEIDSIQTIYFDDETAWTSGGGVTSKFDGYLTIKTVLDATASDADNISTRMGATRIYEGCAYVYFKFKLTGVTDDEESPFARRVPTRLTIVGNGAKLYDPRLDSTVDGGSGSHRVDDQSTWQWTDDIGSNPALQLLWFLLGYYITNPVTSDDILSVGMGIPADRIDLESFATAANICDESVTAIGGGTELRYQSGGVWSETDNPTTIIDMLKATMNADLDDVDGKMRLFIFTDDLSSIEADFTAADVLNDFEWAPVVKLEDRYNIVRGLYTDPSGEALYQPVDYPEVSTTSNDGIDRVLTLNLPMVESAGQAQRLASLKLLRAQLNGIFRSTFQATAWAVQKNDVVRLTFPQIGATNKLFRVIDQEHRPDGTVPMVLRAEAASLYVAPTLLDPVNPVASTPRDVSLDPLVAKVNGYEIRGQAEILVATSNDGTIKVGQVNPRFVQYRVLKNGVDVTESSTWSVTSESAYVDATISNASTTEGRLNLIEADTSGALDVRATLDAQSAEFRVKVTRERDAPPVSGNNGGTSASGSIDRIVTSSTMVAISDELFVDSGTNGDVDLTASYNFNNFTNPVQETETFFTRWYNWNGASYVAIGTEVQATQNTTTTGFPEPFYIEGEGTHNLTDSPGASSSEQYRLYGRGGTANELEVTGSVSATGS